MSVIRADELSAIISEENLERVEELGGVKGLAEHLDANIDTGISKSSIPNRKEDYGSNEIDIRELPTFINLIKEALNDDTLKILIMCAFGSIILEYFFSKEKTGQTWWIDGVAILIAVSIVSIVQAVSNYRQELQFNKTNSKNISYPVAVTRDGEMVEVNSNDIVVGDIVTLKPGDKIPADGIIVKSDDLEINMSAINGESMAVPKSIENPFLFSGTLVNQGTGQFMALAVGSHSSYGRIFDTLTSEQKRTPLQEKLEDLASDIGFAGVLVAILTFTALSSGWVYSHIRTGFSWQSATELLDFLVEALTIIVVAVPEGLPLAVTISLAYSMRKMMSDHNFVRHLNACETMGSTTVICTDKTGTLTLNEMNVEKLIVGLSNTKADEIGDTVNADLQNQIFKAVSVNTAAHVSKRSVIGTQTECALVRFVQSQNVDVEAVRGETEVVKVFQFDNRRKMMTTVTRNGDRLWSTTKGAPEYILARCNWYISEGGVRMAMTDRDRAAIRHLNEENCGQAYRTLAVAYREMWDAPLTAEYAEADLTMLCIFAIRDGLRPSTRAAIEQCQRAGIRVVMITGDNELTAKAIAAECRIDSDGRSIITGEHVRALIEDGKREKASEEIANACVVARSTPFDKQLIVESLQERNEVVAVTGDGTNDAPALRMADIGLSMGRCGTELAKEASDIVILDDDFKSIVSSVRWGRCIYKNVRRFLQFQLTANVVTLFISFISSVLLNDTPFKAVQLLWVNLIMDSLGALALATSTPSDDLLERPPNKRDDPLISDFMVQNIGSQSLFQIVLLLLILVFPHGVEPQSQHHYVLLFNAFVYCQVFNLINARVVDRRDSLTKGLLSNPLYVLIMIGIAVTQYLLVQYGGKFFSSVPLSENEWRFSILAPALCIPFGMVMRMTEIRLFGMILAVLKRLPSAVAKAIYNAVMYVKNNIM